jgi:hypothetical protein
MPNPARIDRDQIKPIRTLSIANLHKIMPRRSDQMGLFPGRQSKLRKTSRPRSLLDFDKHQNVAVQRNEVNFLVSCMMPTRNQRVPLGQKKLGRQVLRVLS